MNPRPPLIILFLLSLGLLFAFFAMFVESQQQDNNNNSHYPPPPPSPPPPSPPPPSPPPPPPPPPPPSPPPPPPAAPPPPEIHPNFIGSEERVVAKKHGKFNIGQKIGVLFLCIVVLLQIGVVGFLAFKRTQLLKISDGLID